MFINKSNILKKYYYIIKYSNNFYTVIKAKLEFKAFRTYKQFKQNTIDDL